MSAMPCPHSHTDWEEVKPTSNRQQAFEAMYRTYLDDVRRYILRRLPAEAWEDVAAETFTIAWRRFDTRPKDEAPWILAIARRVIANYRRSANRRKRLEFRVASAEQAAIGDEQHVTGEPENVAGILRAFHSLSPFDQEALALIAWDELTPSQAAHVVGCSTVAFRVRLHRARSRFHDALMSRQSTETQSDSGRLIRHA